MINHSNRQPQPNGHNKGRAEPPFVADGELAPAWVQFVRYCQLLEHGEVEKLKIQNGLPVMAEITTRKVKFTL